MVHHMGGCFYMKNNRLFEMFEKLVLLIVNERNETP